MLLLPLLSDDDFNPFQRPTVVTTSPPGRDAKYSDKYVCLFVCLSTRIIENHTAEFHQILYMLNVAVARSSMRYLLPVLWRTSYFHTLGPVARIKHDVMLEEVHRVAVPVGRQTTTVFGRVHQTAAVLLSTIDML